MTLTAGQACERKLLYFDRQIVVWNWRLQIISSFADRCHILHAAVNLWPIIFSWGALSEVREHVCPCWPDLNTTLRMIHQMTAALFNLSTLAHGDHLKMQTLSFPTPSQQKNTKIHRWTKKNKKLLQPLNTNKTHFNINWINILFNSLELVWTVPQCPHSDSSIVNIGYVDSELWMN